MSLELRAEAKLDRPLKKLIRFLVIHQTDTDTAAAMLAAFNTPKHDSKGVVYYTGTNYSVDRTGRIDEWADPSKYWTNNSTGKFTDQSIGIDFVLRGGQRCTEIQFKAGAALIKTLATLYDIPLVLAPDRQGGADPPIKDEDMSKYGIFRHRSFAPTKPTACCGNVQIDEMVSYIKLKNTLGSVKFVNGG